MSLLSIVAALDSEILNDPLMAGARLDELLEMQRELGLLHGTRPTCPFLRPHILERSQYTDISSAASTVAEACEKLVQRALSDPIMIETLGATISELNLARIDPGYTSLCVTSRLDSYLSDSGFQFLEYNAESPAGVGDQMQLEKLLFSLTHNEAFLRRYPHWLPEPHRRLLLSLIEAYREWGGEEERPQIAIIDWSGVDTGSEFRVLQRYFEGEGYPTLIADPRELDYHGGSLWVGKVRIDIVYKRVVIHEFLERLGEEHALARAYAAGRICMMNSFRSKLAHKKAVFAILSDPQFENLFSSKELEVLRRRIPWTRRVGQGRTTFEGVEQDLLSLIRKERERFVLKPNDDYGGHGVFIGWEMDRAKWETAIGKALTRPYVVQERVPVKKISMPMFGDRVTLEDMFVDFNPFLFHNKVEGALVRLSSSSLLNVTSGGGQTALLVLDELNNEL